MTEAESHSIKNKRNPPHLADTGNTSQVVWEVALPAKWFHHDFSKPVMECRMNGIKMGDVGLWKSRSFTNIKTSPQCVVNSTSYQVSHCETVSILLSRPPLYFQIFPLPCSSGRPILCSLTVREGRKHLLDRAIVRICLLHLSGINVLVLREICWKK